MIDDKKFVDVKVEIEEDDDCFKPICNSYFIPDIEDLKPENRLPENSIKDFVNYNSGSRIGGKKLRTKESRQEPPERRTCSLCGKMFSRRDYMLLHCSKLHNLCISGFYRCDMCSGQNTFKLRARLEEHMMVHLNTHSDKNFKYYQCEECKSTYMNAKDLISHNYYQHGKEIKKPRVIKPSKSQEFQADLETSFLCDLCSTPFNIKAKLQEHLMRVHLGITNSVKDKLKYYECHACFESYLNFDELQSHSLFVHSKPLYRKDSSKSKSNRFKQIKTDPYYSSPFACELCPESFSKEHRLIDHRLKIHKTGYKCLKCDISFEAKKDLLFHNHIHVDFVRKLSAEEITMKYECILCAFKCYQENDLYQHLPCHVNEFSLNTTGKLLVCNNCSTILKDYDSLHSHVGVHNEVVSHECLKCNKKFPMGNRLLRHLMKHKVNEKVKCNYENCSYYCATKPQMRDHVKHKHLDEVVHLCSICGQSFGQPGSLRNHIKNIHDKSNHIYQCNMCPKTFRVPSHLRNHQAVHTTEFNFKCEHPGCTKAFRAKRNLQIHLRFHDRSQLNYKWPCDYCERKFLTRDAVKRHSFTHTKGFKLYLQINL